jgi:hypothetical protein
MEISDMQLETYKVVVPFTAAEGQHVVVINGVCVGVSEGGQALKHDYSPPPPQATVKRKSLTLTDRMSVVAAMNALSDAGMWPFTVRHISKHLGWERDPDYCRLVSAVVANMLKDGKLAKVGNGRYGPYKLTNHHAQYNMDDLTQKQQPATV